MNPSEIITATAASTTLLWVLRVSFMLMGLIIVAGVAAPETLKEQLYEYLHRFHVL